jgi:hypothetical protein
MTRDKQKARTATMVKSLCIDVVSALDDYQSWATEASATGRITPVQFLAVVLWAVSTLEGRDLSESEVNGVISKWWERLVKATVKRGATLGGHGPYRLLYPFDVLTLLELDQCKVSTTQGWWIRIDDADEWLCGNGAGAWCADFFSASNQADTVEEPFKFSEEFTELCASRKLRKGEVWTDADKCIVWAAICAHPNRTSGLREYIAQSLGLESAEAVSKLVRGKKRPVKTVSIVIVRDGKKVA